MRSSSPAASLRDYYYFYAGSKECEPIKRDKAQIAQWFSRELGEWFIPDGFIDIFQGRAPRSMLARHYTGRELLRLK